MSSLMNGHAGPSSEATNATGNSREQALAARALKRAEGKAEKKRKAEMRKEEGNAHFKAGRYTQAAECYKTACDVYGANVVYMSNLAACYIKMEQWHDAEFLCSATLLLDPRHLKVRYRRGLARKGLNLLQAAVSDFEAVLTIDPDCHEAQVELEAVYEMIDDDEGSETGKTPSEDDFPSIDYPAKEFDDDSASATSDCLHTGNAIPCRFYNHGGCQRGTKCMYSHAPDDKSVRDDLGQNVCRYFLMNSCKFGATKCVYSHSRENLPSRGWWNDPQQVQMAQAVYDVDKDMRRDPFGTGRFLPSALEREMRFAKQKRKAPHSATQAPQVGLSAGAPTRPRVLLLSLADAATFNSIHRHFMQALRARAEVIQVRNSKDVPQSLSSNVSAVYATDADITKKKHSKLLTKLVAYVKEGGTFVVGGQFSGHVTPSDNDSFFKHAWGLDWKMGSYHRTTFALNPSRPERLHHGPQLAASYSMKTVHLEGVLPEAVVYTPTPDSRLQSMVFSPVTVPQSEVPVAYTRLGEGYLGYIGDVNGEDDSTSVILSMLGMPAEVSSIPFEPKGKSKGKKKSRGYPGGYYGGSSHPGDILDLIGYDLDPDDEDAMEERMVNGGFTDDELSELLCQGIKPWEVW